MKELVAISESFKVTTVVLPAEKKDVTATLTPGGVERGDGSYRGTRF